VPVIFTAIARLHDWRALGTRNRDIWLARMRAAGAHRYRLYRNVHDASQLLLVAELPDHDALCAMRETLDPELAALAIGAGPDERVWEPTALEGIG
jgi:hypothetical protein